MWETQGALPLDPAKGSSTLWTPFRAIELTSLSYCFRVLIEVTQGALPLDPAKGSSTLWTPVCAIQLSAFSCYARVLIRERHQCRPKPPPNPFEFPTTVLLCVTVALVEPIVTVYVSPTTKSALENTTLFALFTVKPVYSTVP